MSTESIAAPGAGTAGHEAPASDVVPASASSAPPKGPVTVYEVNAEVDPEVAVAYDAWLPGHIDRILALPGFIGADVLRRETVEEGPRTGWNRRTIQYRLASPRDLQNYLDTHAARLRSEALERFGDRVQFERRVLSHVARREHDAAAEPAKCRNCGQPAPGQYCAACGQRSPVRVLSLWELIREAAGDLTHSDSRVWQTLVPLLIKPGQLTREYLLGRRARYLPPFRLYLVLSVACFVFLGLGESDEPFLEFDEKMQGELDKLDPAERAEAEARLANLPEAARRALHESGLTVPPPADPVSGETKPATPPSTASAAGAPESSAPDSAASRVGPCDGVNLGLGSREAQAKLMDIWRKIAVDKGKRFSEALIDNIPKMMFIFLPLIALVSFVLHAFSGRYYVEHLLFFVHFHAFVFLAFILQSLFSLVGERFTPLQFVARAIAIAMTIYLPIYLYKAMRRVFQQGRALTLIKFVLLSGSYVVCLLVTFLGILLYTGWTL